MIPHPVTGEALDLANASTEDIAGMLAGLAEMRTRLSDFEDQAGAEILRRLDAEARWTLHLGNGLTVKAPSPDAGTEKYPADVLHDSLAALIGEDTITEDAASRALVQVLCVTVEVPVGLDGESAVAAIGASTLMVDGRELPVASASISRKVSAAGIKALRKVPGMDSVLAEIRKVEPVVRRVKVTAE